MTNLNDVIYLSEEQFNTLKSGGSITKDGEIFTYDDNSMYVVEVDIRQLVIDVLNEKFDGMISNATVENGKLKVNRFDSGDFDDE